jgi:hypothetical protein
MKLRLLIVLSLIVPISTVARAQDAPTKEPASKKPVVAKTADRAAREKAAAAREKALTEATRAAQEVIKEAKKLLEQVEASKKAQATATEQRAKAAAEATLKADAVGKLKKARELEQASLDKSRAKNARARSKSAQKKNADKAKKLAAEAKKKSDIARKKIEDDQKKAARLTKLRAAKFDRRPSTILNTWAVPKKGKQKTAKKAPNSTARAPSKTTPKGSKKKYRKKKRKARIPGSGIRRPVIGLGPTGSSGVPVIPGQSFIPGQPFIPGQAQAPGAAVAKNVKKSPFDFAIERWQRNVTLGNWKGVKNFLASLAKDEAKVGYEAMLRSLNTPILLPSTRRLPVQVRKYAEKNVFSVDDMLAITRATPCKLEKKLLDQLGKILKLALDAGHTVESFLAKSRKELKAGDKSFASRRELAKILFAANETVLVGEFLPTVDQAKASSDHEALNLLARFHVALHAKEKKSKHLKNAWAALQSIFTSPKIKAEDKEEALTRAVELAPQISEELGQKWLEESFSKHPKRGMEIVSVIGSAASRGLEKQAMNPDFRLKGLKLQSVAVSALVKSAPNLANKWSGALKLLAANWLNEANFSYQYDQSTNIGPSMQRDRWGNVFYMNWNRFNRMNNQRFKAIPVGKLLEIKPSATLLALLDDSTRPHFSQLFAKLLLKVSEEDQAFPYIEKLAKTHPKQAKVLVEEFLKVWARAHNPNANKGRTNYFYMYGYRARAEGIPLTRSKQERNLKELAKWVARLQNLNLGDLNEELLTSAFTNCHSQAEVYRLEAIEKVFGKLEKLKPKTLASLIQKMRVNLVGVWRQPAVQKNQKTNRKQRDIESEVLKGYQVAQSVASSALKKHPKSWELQLAKACILHDENNYRAELKASSNFTQYRKEAFAAFDRAAQMYAAKVVTLPEDEQTAEVYEYWFSAGLGACDLSGVTARTQSDRKQSARIRAAIDKLPEDLREHHTDLFAGSLFARMGSAKPEIKFRYLKSGLMITGDHKRAAEARKVLDYYKDLITEIKLDANVDGSDVVGHGQPFGLFVNIRHTREIERESGGFGRYLQNQNAGRFNYYNFGRPLENYRDKFEDMANQALSEHFEILSITFQSDEVNSKALSKYGWRATPYAYILLKARGAEVDKIPSLRLDLDFMDSSGYVIIPIESPGVPIDASAINGKLRPCANLEVTQILDERQASDGKLVLELKVQGDGLIADWPAVLDFKPADFTITESLDQKLSVSKFNPDSEETVIISQRSWLISMKANDGLKEFPKTFQFGRARGAKKASYQRYIDEDLVQVKEQISLEHKYGEPSNAGAWLWIALFIVGSIIIVLIKSSSASSEDVLVSDFEMPESVTPFTVMALLESIRDRNGIDAVERTELDKSLTGLEDFYFRNKGQKEPDLTQLANDWLSRIARPLGR